MKYIYFIFALLTITTSCELRSTNFDPDNQLVSDDELAEISIWDHYQPEVISAEEYESRNPKEFINTEFTYRQNSQGKWVIEGSIKNFASKAHFKDAQMSISYYSDTKLLIGMDFHTINENLAPGDHAGFYFKSDKFKDAHSLKVEIKRVKSVRQ